jgi:predicted GNAT family acetyltransferase
MERDLMIPAGRRWFVVREPSGTTVAFAALLALEGVAFIDHVVTLPSARRRGLATAVTRRILAEVRAAGVERTFLLAEPEGIAARMYARLGFENVSHLASWLAPLDEAEGSQAGGAR